VQHRTKKSLLLLSAAYFGFYLAGCVSSLPPPHLDHDAPLCVGIMWDAYVEIEVHFQATDNSEETVRVDTCIGVQWCPGIRTYRVNYGRGVVRNYPANRFTVLVNDHWESPRRADKYTPIEELK